ncbi:MAG: DUF2149 domain-containing protein [Pirellulales bacterium]
MRTKRLWHSNDDDPLAGLINLFDLWIVVIVVLILMIVQSSQMELTAQSMDAALEEEQPSVQTTWVRLQNAQSSQNPMSGKGTPLGMAYQLENGQIVYVPTATKP